jgi:hypothetical protein
MNPPQGCLLGGIVKFTPCLSSSAAAFETHCCVLTVSPLLRELILASVALPQLYPLGGPEERLASVLLDEIRDMHVAPLHLPLPRDP